MVSIMIVIILDGRFFLFPIANTNVQQKYTHTALAIQQHQYNWVYMKQIAV